MYPAFKNVTQERYVNLEPELKDLIAQCVVDAFEAGKTDWKAVKELIENRISRLADQDKIKFEHILAMMADNGREAQTNSRVH
jgi:hypothetical protein